MLHCGRAELAKALVQRCAGEYDRRYDTQYEEYRDEEAAIMFWLDTQPPPKYLDEALRVRP